MGAREDAVATGSRSWQAWGGGVLLGQREVGTIDTARYHQGIQECLGFLSRVSLGAES